MGQLFKMMEREVASLRFKRKRLRKSQFFEPFKRSINDFSRKPIWRKKKKKLCWWILTIFCWFKQMIGEEREGSGRWKEYVFNIHFHRHTALITFKEKAWNFLLWLFLKLIEKNKVLLFWLIQRNAIYSYSKLCENTVWHKRRGFPHPNLQKFVPT